MSNIDKSLEDETLAVNEPKENNLEEWDNTYTISNKNKNFQLRILNKEIQTLRPITILPDKTKMILVYLPTKKTSIPEKENEMPITEFHNMAYFISQRGDVKEIIPIESKNLKENYKINVMPQGFESRWEISDLKSWLKNTGKINPAKIFKIQQSLTTEYLDFELPEDYTYFDLWNIGTYFYELFNAFPYNDYTGIKRVGKSKALEYQSLTCFNAIMTADVSSSAIFRLIEGVGATFLLDETESFKNKNKDGAQNIRTLLLEGFLKNKFAFRSEAQASGGFVPTPFNLYSPKSLGHITSLDNVLEDRCIEQLMQRSQNPKILGTWPTSKDTRFSELRALCYKLFLDYGDEIQELQHKARKLLDVNGRELQLWTPIITLALFFENHGIAGIINQIKSKAERSRKERQEQDEQSSIELKILQFLDKYIVEYTKENPHINNNPIGWIPIKHILGSVKLSELVMESSLS